MTQQPETDATPAGGSRTNRVLVLLLLVCALLASGAFAYWRYVYYPTTPQYALDTFLRAAETRDYQTAYDRLHLPAPLRIIVPSSAALRQWAERAGGLIPELQSHSLGKVTAKADTATIESVFTTRSAGSANSPATTTSVNVEMRRIDGIWKVDGAWALRELTDRGTESLLDSLVR